MKNIVSAIFIATVFAACGNSDQAAFVTLLGSDTLAVEQFQKTDTGITAHVILRSPETRFSTYYLKWDETGGIEKMLRTDYPASTGFTGEGNVVQTVARDGDSLLVKVSATENTRRYKAPYQPGVLPFIDMMHWPFEIALNRAAEAGQDTVNQPLLTGTRLSNFIIAAIEPDSMTIRHPFRGVMGVRVDGNGNLEYLDAGLTTRKLKVHRVNALDLDALSARFANHPVGPLSGAERAEFSFKGADFTVEFGSPHKRDRELFGGIVPYGEVWRTGANRATHFYTSKDLSFAGLKVPAGEFTLFSIPEAEDGMLIINSQTGQNGTSYDENRDLGRVPMQVTTKEEVTEAFTITLNETGEGGRINLIWGNTVYSADFVIK